MVVYIPMLSLSTLTVIQSNLTEQEMEIARAMTATFTKTPQKNIDNLKGSNPASVPHQLTQEEARAVSADSHLQSAFPLDGVVSCEDAAEMHYWMAEDDM